jgi:hypothetical protein
VLEGCEQEEEVRPGFLRPRQFPHAEAGALAALRLDGGPPLAVPAVEHEHPVAGAKAQDVEEVVRLPPVERQVGAASEGGVHEEARGGEVVTGQASTRDGVRERTDNAQA